MLVRQKVNLGGGHVADGAMSLYSLQLFQTPLELVQCLRSQLLPSLVYVYTHTHTHTHTCARAASCLTVDDHPLYARHAWKNIGFFKLILLRFLKNLFRFLRLLAEIRRKSMR